MAIYKGQSVYKGTVVGRIKLIQALDKIVSQETVKDKAFELYSLDNAIEKSKAQLSSLYEKAYKEVGSEGADIFRVQQMILEDPEFINRIKGLVEDKEKSAAFALDIVEKEHKEHLLNANDEYIRARAVDVQDVSRRLRVNLGGLKADLYDEQSPVILVSPELSAGTLMTLDRNKISGIITSEGSPLSHMAILARMMCIPTIVACNLDFTELRNGETVILLAGSGEVIFSPSDTELGSAYEQIGIEKNEKKALLKIKDEPAITKSGKRVFLSANIGGKIDVENAIINKADGIGLFRSEMLYLGRDTVPTQEEQFEEYKSVLQAMDNNSCVIRTLDVGGDKWPSALAYLEHGSTLGLRGVRVCLEQRELFLDQLKALLRAAVYGELSIMYPMITAMWELDEIDLLIEQAKAELTRDNIEWKMPKTGVMIETPSAVMISRELTQRVDFVSIGTNDLTQFTLAVGREETSLSRYYDSKHPAVLQMIELVTENAHKNNKKVSVCGELASDEEMTEYFVKLGIDELSVAPAYILNLRKKIREID